MSTVAECWGAEWSSVYVSRGVDGCYQGSCSWPRGDSRHNLVWTWRQEAAVAKLEVSAGDLLTPRPFNSPLPLSHTQASSRTHVQKQSAQVCAVHTLTHKWTGEKKTKKKHMRLHDPHTQAHTQATAEWSQLERQRHFGLSTARISGQVRTTHTDGHKTTHAHLSLRRLTSTWNYCLHNLDPLWQNLCIYGNCAIFCL